MTWCWRETLFTLLFWLLSFSVIWEKVDCFASLTWAGGSVFEGEGVCVRLLVLALFFGCMSRAFGLT